jgi:hypothetical protein
VVELRLGKICSRLAQDLVRTPQLALLALEQLDPLLLLGRQAWAPAPVARSSWRTHSRRVSAVHPTFVVIH